MLCFFFFFNARMGKGKASVKGVCGLEMGKSENHVHSEYDSQGYRNEA